MIRLLHVPVGGTPTVVWIDPTLEAMQALVGGYLEAVNPGRLLPPQVALYCNEDGIERQLPPNGCGILGSYFFSAHDAHGDPRSLDAGELAAASLFYQIHRKRLHPTAR
jgi:hypothetical protein